jgi:hypothetical protein
MKPWWQLPMLQPRSTCGEYAGYVFKGCMHNAQAANFRTLQGPGRVGLASFNSKVLDIQQLVEAGKVIQDAV